MLRNARKHLTWMGLGLLTMLVPVTAGADSLGEELEEIEAHMDEVAEEVDEEGHHGALHLRDVFQGEHSLEFWGAVVNFVLLLLVLRKLGKAPLRNFLESRQQTVEQGMKEAAEIKAKAQQVYDDYNARLKSMDADIEQLKQDIRVAAEADKKRILEDAKQHAERLQAETETLIDRQSQELAQTIREEVVDAAVRAAEQLIRSALDPEQQRTLAEQFRAALVNGEVGEAEADYEPKRAAGGQS